MCQEAQTESDDTASTALILMQAPLKPNEDPDANKGPHKQSENAEYRARKRRTPTRGDVCPLNNAC